MQISLHQQTPAGEVLSFLASFRHGSRLATIHHGWGPFDPNWSLQILQICTECHHSLLLHVILPLVVTLNPMCVLLCYITAALVLLLLFHSHTSPFLWFSYSAMLHKCSFRILFMFSSFILLHSHISAVLFCFLPCNVT